ncbi:MAG: hypothetical protein E7408_03755 [Ruminococcaceae bacterium]|nr:hypothetical protein [Oscillospiraceae bacterium]
MYYTKEYLCALAPKIRMSEEALNALLALMPSISPAEGEALCRFLTDSTVPSVEKRERMERFVKEEKSELHAILIYMAASGYTHEKYRELGMPDEIFYDSMNCLPEKMETNMKYFGVWGYVPYLWPISHLNLNLFRIGRLSYGFTPAGHAPVMNGDKVLVPTEVPYVNMHISDNEKLVGGEESIRAAREFFRKFFPEYGDCVYMTDTWLIDPLLGEILSPASNIMQFQNLFHIIDRYDCRKEVLNRVFGEEKENLDEYVPTTSLARSVLAYLKSGKELGRGIGYTKI